MKRLEYWLYHRPSSIWVFLGFGLSAGLLSLIWQPLFWVPLGILLVLLVYFPFVAPWWRRRRET